MLGLSQSQIRAFATKGFITPERGPRGELRGFVLGTVGEVFLFFTFAEVAPKTYAVKNPERASLMMSPLLVFVTRFLPLRVFVSGFIGLANTVLPGKDSAHTALVTEAEILAMVDVAADEASIRDEEKELIHSVLEIGDTPVSDVMVPRTQMHSVEASSTVNDAVSEMIDSGYSRLPCFEESTDDIKGLGYLKDLVRRAARGEGSQPVRSSLREGVFVPESKKVAELLRMMQAKKFHMAVVVDEYGGTAGIVTMEDLLEEIVGEIVDEFDTESSAIEQIDERTWRVPGRTPIGDLEDEVDAELGDDWDTVGGLVFNTLGHVPSAGECVEYAAFEFCAESVDGRRIHSVIVRRLARVAQRGFLDPSSNTDTAGAQ